MAKPPKGQRPNPRQTQPGTGATGVQPATPPAPQAAGRFGRLMGSLKRLKGPIAAIAGAGAILSGFIGWYTSYKTIAGTSAASPAAASAANARSILVLPFTNPGGAKDDEFFSAGITEDMVTQLAQISGLRVASSTSSARYRGSTKAIRDIAQEMDVAYVLVGSVRRGDDRFRITAQLVDARRDETLWARTYDRANQDVLAVQSEVATDIATSLKGGLLAVETEQLAKRAKGNPEAFLLYLRGAYLLGQRIASKEEMEAPAIYLKKSIALDPSSPLGYAGMATYHFNMARSGYLDPQPQYQQANAYLQKALALDGRSVESYIQLAKLHGLAEWNWPEAEKAAKRAIELNPNEAQAWDAYRLAVLEPQGRLDEALAAQQRAVTLDPLNPYIAWRLAFLHMMKGDCEEGMRLTRINIARDPSYGLHRTLLVTCLERQGKYREAIAENRLLKSYWLSDAQLEEQDAALTQGGEAAYWRTRLKHQLQLAQTRRDGWYFAAVVAMHTGQMDDAFRYLSRAMDEHDRNVTFLKIQPDFAPARDDPRFKAALRRMNLLP